MTDAGQWLRAYVAENSEEAFRALVDGHIGLVYSTALRIVCEDAALARDVTQIVFTDLARKARTLPPDVVLSGWLYRHTTFTASKVVRGESRRRAREQEAAAMNDHDQSQALWEQLTPLLDGAMASLSACDRDAVVMRYFEKRDFRSVAASLKVSEDAAQKRVTRALEKLRTYFERRGVAVSTVTLGAAIAANAVNAVPTTLAGTVAVNALAHASAAAAAPFVISLIMAKIKSIAVGAAIVAVVGTPVVMQQQSIARLRAQNQQIKHEQSAQPQTEVRVVPAPLDNRELLQLRAEVARLRREQAERTQVQMEKKTAAAGVRDPAPPVANEPVMSETWADRGFATPMATLETAHWAIRNANIEKFRESLYVTDAARRKLHDVLAKMAASVRPDQAEEARKVLDDVANRGWDAEEGMLFPMIAQDKKHGYKSYRVLTETVAQPDEQQITIELQMNTAAAQTRQFRFKQFGDTWKQVIDVADLPAEVR